MDTNVLNALIVALAQDKVVAVAPPSDTLQIVTLILAAVAPVISALAVYLVRELKENVDGKMSVLLAATSKASHAEGMTEQRGQSAMLEAAQAKGVIEHLKTKSTEQPEVVHQVVSQEIKEQNVDKQTVEETLRKKPPRKM